MEPKDYEDMYGVLSKRINGGSNYSTLLDRLKKEFESKRILTIQNFDSLSGATMQVNEDRWKMESVEETATTYYFVLSRVNVPQGNDVRIGLSRVPMAGHDVEMYNLYNESYGGWVGVGKPALRDKDVLMKKMIELTELPF